MTRRSIAAVGLVACVLLAWIAFGVGRLPRVGAGAVLVAVAAGVISLLRAAAPRASEGVGARALRRPATWIALAIHLAWWTIVWLRWLPLGFLWPGAFTFSFQALYWTGAQEQMLMYAAVPLGMVGSWGLAVAFEALGWLEERQPGATPLFGLLLFAAPVLVLTIAAMTFAILMGWPYLL